MRRWKMRSFGVADGKSHERKPERLSNMGILHMYWLQSIRGAKRFLSLCLSEFGNKMSTPSPPKWNCWAVELCHANWGAMLAPWPQASSTGRSKRLLFEPHGLWHFVTAARADEDSPFSPGYKLGWHENDSSAACPPLAAGRSALGGEEAHRGAARWQHRGAESKSKRECGVLDQTVPGASSASNTSPFMWM